MSDIAKANNLGRKLYTAITSVLFVAYVMEVVKGSQTIGLFIGLMVLCLGPMIATHILYKKNPDSENIKWVIGIGYGIYYMVNCYFSPSQLVFVYGLPMLVIVALYVEVRYIKIICGFYSAIAIVHGVVYTTRVGWNAETSADFEIQVAVMVLVMIFSVISYSFVARMNDEKVSEVSAAGEKTTKMLDEITVVSGNLADGVMNVSEKMNRLSESGKHTLTSMGEVQSGTQDTASSVQVQMVKTEEIQGQIAKVAEASKNIGENADSAVEAITEGKQNLAKLIKQSEISAEAGNGAVKEVEELKSSTEQMETIVQMIQKVASQTSMLALNASIEAARAGEAGRGFSVVAASISDLASQTKSATEEISNLISNLTNEMEDVASAILSLVDSNKMQNESAQLTADSFEKISESAQLISTHSTELNGSVNHLEEANRKIVDSIQTISAITEEVTAHSQTTLDSTGENQVIIGEMQKVVLDMQKNADKLNALR